MQCRKTDQGLVKEALSEASSKIKEALGPCNMKLDTETYLPGPAEKNGSEESDSWCATLAACHPSRYRRAIASCRLACAVAMVALLCCHARHAHLTCVWPDSSCSCWIRQD